MTEIVDIILVVLLVWLATVIVGTLLLGRWLGRWQ
jgi:hypothetical protein